MASSGGRFNPSSVTTGMPMARYLADESLLWLGLSMNGPEVGTYIAVQIILLEYV